MCILYNWDSGTPLRRVLLSTLKSRHLDQESNTISDGMNFLSGLHADDVNALLTRIDKTLINSDLSHLTVSVIRLLCLSSTMRGSMHLWLFKRPIGLAALL
jgi:hypothetical protein